MLTNDVSMTNYNHSLASGIRPSPEFEKKGLAKYAINVGLRCGHDCTYCSSRAMLRTHEVFRDEASPVYKKAFSTGFSIIDPDIAQKVAEDAQRIRILALFRFVRPSMRGHPKLMNFGLVASVLKPSSPSLGGRFAS